MKGLQRLVRRELLARLKADPGLTALVPAGSIHGTVTLTEPSWPFVKLGPSRMQPRKATCLDAGTVTFPIHAFARDGENVFGGITQTAEDHAAEIGEAIEVALDCRGGSFTKGGDTGYVRYRLTDINVMPDLGEAGAFHWFANVEAKVTAA